MESVQVTVRLPEELARDAREFGLLTEDAIVELIQDEVDRRVMDLVNAEIQASRAEKALKNRSQKPR